jgi:cation:H+ antiporter
MDLLYTALGLAILVGAGDALVRGAVSLSLRLGVPALIVSLTIVAFGTSAPELLVSIEAALADADGIAFGNVVGSNIANVLLVMGVPAIISGITPMNSDGRRDFQFMMAGSVVFIALCFMGPMVWWHGLVLLAGLSVMLGNAFIGAQKHRNGTAAVLEEIEDADPHMAPWKIAGLLLVGLAGLPLGADLLIDGARGLALSWGMSEASIGLTLVAVGTSLPELMTSVVAALKKHAEVAIGNVLGSNVFNLLGIMGVASFFGPLDVPQEFLGLDLWVMLATSALMWVCVYPAWHISRAMGVGLIALYVVYAYAVIVPRM